MKQVSKKIFAVIASTAMFITLFSHVGQVYAAMPEYEIYPKPQEISYENSDFILRDKVNAVYEVGIDSYTKARLKEVTESKKLSVNTSEQIDNENKVTNILVGIKGSGGYVDNYVKDNCEVSEQLFTKTDSYYIQVKDGNIVILGRDTDAAFYGLTTLYHVFNQLESRTIRNFELEDYADVVSRGFIEGYYGSPWSTEDRADLMSWSGYYKLNSYFYAPKDDPKHNAKWRELYTEEEIETKIKPLAKAGNESKCRFVFALHPYMNSPIRHNTEENYKADLKIMQDKFEQVIEAGVRQIAILADDAAHVGANNYIKMLNDMTDWLKEKQKTYPDLKLTLPFCVQEYMRWGETYFKDFPDNVQIVMTGGKVFGEASQDFTTKFTEKVGRGPYLWINWPCTDNSRQHLIMGGYDTFLHPGVNPENIEGIVLNPMQQSEPSKVGIFGNAAYSWNIWETKEEADEIWNDSFKYVNHNAAGETEASSAFRELSLHMINQDMIGGDNPVTQLEESVELNKKLVPFKNALTSKTVTSEQVDELIAEFTKLEKASKTYRSQGNARVKDQIRYWLDCWDDTAGSAISYLNAIKATLNDDSTTLLNEYSKGQKLFANSKTHGFQYADHIEYAEVGVQHIVPFIQTLDKYVSQQVSQMANPSKADTTHTVANTTISNNIKISQDGGVLANLTDGNIETETFFQSKTGDFTPVDAAVTFDLGSSKVISSVDIAQGISAKGDIITNGVVECSQNGTTWSKFGDVTAKNQQTVTGQNVKARYVRIRNLTQVPVWWRLSEVTINASIDYEIIKTERWVPTSGNPEKYLNDGDNNTFVWYDPDGEENTTNDDVLVNDYLGYDLGKVTQLASAHIAVGNTGRDKLKNYCIETSITGGESLDEWTPVSGYENYTGAATGIDDLNINLDNVEARYIRIRNLEVVDAWVKFSEFTVQESQGDTGHLYTNISTSLDAQVSSTAEQATLSTGEVTLNSQDYIGIKLDRIQELQKITMNLSSNDGIKLQVSKNALEWVDTNAGDLNLDARYIRIINTKADSVTFDINEFKVNSYIIQPIHLEESNIPITSGWGDTRNNGLAFDGNITTTNKFGGNPSKGQYIIYDLGQSLHMNSLRTYVADSELDFIRDAKFQVSDDLTTWQDAFTIGDGATDTDRTSTARNSEVFQNNDSKYPNYLYEGNDELDLTGRYLRILVTADFPQRSININEIIINGGAYIPVENNRDYVGALEEKGHHPSLMGDGDLTTTYKSALKNNAITYYVSDANGWKTFKIIQSGEISGASVTATFYDAVTRNTSKAFKVGTLNQAINEFIIPEGKKLISIEISWKEIIPEISEIILSKNTTATIDKTALNTALKQEVNTAWTKDSQTAFNQAKATAQEIADSEYYSQQVIDSVTKLLNLAVTEAEIKADSDALNEIIENALTNDKEYYSTNTFKNYETKLNELKSALESVENLSQKDADLLVKNIEDAKKALSYSIAFRENAKLAILDDITFDSENYSTDTYTKYQIAKKALETAIQEDDEATGQAQRVHPKDMDEKTEKFIQAKDQLADITVLKARIAEFNGYDPSLYTADSFKAYEDAINDGKALLVTGTIETVAQQITLIDQKKDALVSGDSVPLDEVIADALKVNKDNYTEKSYNELMDAVREAQANQSPTPEEKVEYVEKITEAKKSLVSIVALKQRIAEAKTLDKNLFTTQSYQILEDVLSISNDVMKDGSEKDVSDLLDKLNKAISKLERSGIQEWKKYTASLKLKDSKDYTKESYNAYFKAYNKLMQLTGDISLKDFTEAKNEYEKYNLLLQYKLADYALVNQIISKIPKDLSLYDSQAVQRLKQVLSSIKYDKTIQDQGIVDQYAKDLQAALDNLLNNKKNPNVQTGDKTSVLFMSMALVLAGYGIYTAKKKHKKDHI